MAFDFLGTLNVSQLLRQAQFVDDQVSLVQGMIDHLQFEQGRIGTIKMTRENNIPVSYTVDSQSYIGKLVAAYVALGGDPYYDLNIRAFDEPVYLEKGTEATGTGRRMSNGEVVGAPGLGDKQSALLVRDLRAPFVEVIKARRDYLERKIRRSLDYYDQLTQEISALEGVLALSMNQSAVDATTAALDDLTKDPVYYALYNDQAHPDPLGLYTHAPIAPYEPGPNRGPNDTDMRGVAGFVPAGTKG
jgi:hypothetical protein